MILSLLLVFAIGATSCATVAVNEEKDRQLVIAKVNDVDILKADLLDIYEQQKAYYGITEDQEADPSMTEQIQQMKVSILDVLIENEVINQEAKAAGYEVTEAEIKQAEEDTVASILEYYKTIDASNEDAKDKTEDEYRQDALEYIQTEADTMGVTVESIYQDIAEQEMVNQYRDEELKEVKASGSDVEQWYVENLATQQGDPSQAAYAQVKLYEPEGVQVKHILIQLDENELLEYQAKLTEEDGETKAREYADSVLLDDVESVLAQAKETPDEFEALIDEYGEDPGMVDNDEGYFVQATGQYMPAFEETALAMKSGEISEPIFIDGGRYVGYHIIKAYEVKASVIYELEEKQEEIQVILDEEKKTTAWNEKVAEWVENADVKKYEKRLK